MGNIDLLLYNVKNVARFALTYMSDVKFVPFVVNSEKHFKTCEKIKPTTYAVIT